MKYVKGNTKFTMTDDIKQNLDEKLSELMKRVKQLNQLKPIKPLDQDKNGSHGFQKDHTKIHIPLVTRIVTAIYQRYGIHSTEDTTRKLHRLFDTKQGDYESQERWVALLEKNSFNTQEWTAFIESVLVHETYFFRDKSQLNTIRYNVLSKLIENKMNSHFKRLRIWTAACSTGEETYTLAILVLDALSKANQTVETISGEVIVNNNWNIEILGTDISWVSIVKANEACYSTYGLSSFRDMPCEFDRFFQPIGDEKVIDRRDIHNNRRKGCESLSQGTGDKRTISADRRQRNFTSKYLSVSQNVKRLVRFEINNLISETPPGTDFDIVFCRNVLIYFDVEAKRKAQLTLSKALTKGGYMVLGPSDTLLWPELFETVRCENAVYYKKK